MTLSVRIAQLACRNALTFAYSEIPVIQTIVMPMRSQELVRSNSHSEARMLPEQLSFRSEARNLLFWRIAAGSVAPDPKA
jgi:hypothetical protein